MTNEDKDSPKPKFVRIFWALVFGVPGAFFMVRGALIFVDQVLGWLKSGTWISQPLMLAGTSSDWVGINIILSYIPISISFVVVGLLLVAIGAEQLNP